MLDLRPKMVTFDLKMNNKLARVCCILQWTDYNQEYYILPFKKIFFFFLAFQQTNLRLKAFINECN